MNIYLQLTEEFNDGKLRAIVSSGQAVVLHRLAIMSKDGDWILREDTETMRHVLDVLSRHGARYRFGAPLDIRWLSRGWSAHFEFRRDPLRVRTDFVTRPARVSEGDLQALWKEQEGKAIPYVGLDCLADIKKTNREKDYAIIGELARLMDDPRSRLLYSRSPRDLIRLAQEQPDLARELVKERPILARVAEGIEGLERALDAERRSLMRANEARLKAFMEASERWARQWEDVQKEIATVPLSEAHEIIAHRAESLLPFEASGSDRDA